MGGRWALQLPSAAMVPWELSRRAPKSNPKYAREAEIIRCEVKFKLFGGAYNSIEVYGGRRFAWLITLILL